MNIILRYRGLNARAFWHGLVEAQLKRLQNLAAIASAQVTLEWDSNTEPDLDGYKVYYGTTVGSYEFVVDVGNQTVYTVTGLDRGETYFFAATAYNVYGTESAYSSEISCEIPL